MPISNRTVKAFAGKFAWRKVISKAGGAKKEGDRVLPSRSGKNDANLNFRIDKRYTDPRSGEVKLMLQANLNPKDSEVRKAA